MGGAKVVMQLRFFLEWPENEFRPFFRDSYMSLFPVISFYLRTKHTLTFIFLFTTNLRAQYLPPLLLVGEVKSILI